MTADALIAARRKWVAARKQEGVEGVFRAQANALPLPPSFHDAVRVARADRGVVAEFKRRDDHGMPLVEFEVLDFVMRAQTAGACAIAIWPDEEIHGGSYHDILAAAQASPLPVLSLDPVIDPVQVVMARAHGAAAITIDAAHVRDDELRALFRHATDLGLDIMIQASSALGLDRVSSLRLGPSESSGARVIAVRPCESEGTAELDVYEKLAPAIPEFAARLAAVCPGPEGVARLDAAGYDAVFTSEYLLRSHDLEAAMRDIAGEPFLA